MGFRERLTMQPQTRIKDALSAPTGAEVAEEANDPLATMARWLCILWSLTAPLKEQQHASLSLVRFSAVPENCEAIVKAGGVRMLLHVISDARSMRPFPSSSAITSAVSSPSRLSRSSTSSPRQSSELKRLSSLSSHAFLWSSLEQRAMSSTSKQPHSSTASPNLQLPDETLHIMDCIPAVLSAMHSESPTGPGLHRRTDSSARNGRLSSSQSSRSSLEVKREDRAANTAERAVMTLANVAMSSPQHAELMLFEGAMMVLLKLMTSGEFWAEKSAGHALMCLCTQMKHALARKNKDLIARLLNSASADACSKMPTLAQALVCEAEACQHAAIMIASLTTSWTPFSDEQLEQLAEAGGVDGLIRSALVQALLDRKSQVKESDRDKQHNRPANGLI